MQCKLKSDVRPDVCIAVCSMHRSSSAAPAQPEDNDIIIKIHAVSNMYVVMYHTHKNILDINLNQQPDRLIADHYR